jgi:hypothetical protein
VHHLEAAKGADKHEERRARQMKVCQENVYHFEFISRRYEDIRLTRIGQNATVV